MFRISENKHIREIIKQNVFAYFVVKPVAAAQIIPIPMPPNATIKNDDIDLV